MAGTSGELSRQLAERVERAAGDFDVVVALGGGADSAALLATAVDALTADRVQAVFVFHGLEGSDVVAKAAHAVSDEVGVDFTMLTATVSDGPNLEARARDARYTAIEAHVGDGPVVMTGHSRDDQAETVLMRMASGSGSRGLRGIPGVRGRWRRPFLDVPREDLAAIAAARGLTVADDPANHDSRFTRTRVRHAVVPALDAHLPGDVRAGLARSAMLIGLDDELVDDLASWIPVREAPDSVSIAAAPLVTVPAAIAARAIQRGLRVLLGGQPGTSADVAAVIDTARSGTTHALSQGLVAIDDGPEIRIRQAPPTPPEPIGIEVGSSFVWAGRRYAVRRFASLPTMLEGGRFTALSGEAVPGALVARAPQPGDRLDIGVGSTPVTELLRVHGVAPDQRPVSLLIVDSGKIAAVVGVRTAAWAAPRPGSPVIIIEREVTT